MLNPPLFSSSLLTTTPLHSTMLFLLACPLEGRLNFTDILVKGGDYKVEEIAGAQFVLENGGSVELLPYEEGFSTTGTIKKIVNNEQ